MTASDLGIAPALHIPGELRKVVWTGHLLANILVFDVLAWREETGNCRVILQAPSQAKRG
jgi:hypothetical protein